MPAWARLEVGGSLTPAAYSPTLGVIPYSKYTGSAVGAVNDGSFDVPEPGTIGMAVIAALELLKRRIWNGENLIAERCAD